MDEKIEKLNKGLGEDYEKLEDKRNKDHQEFMDLDKDIYSFAFCANMSPEKFTANQLISFN
jgi:hypothetical protein